MAQDVKRAVCEMCHAKCRVTVYSDHGRLVKINEDPTDPRVDKIFPPTKACIRLRGSKEFMYHPDRVNFPLKRAGDKGEGKWQTIPWEQALDEIADRLQGLKGKYGAETLALTRGTGRTTQQFFGRFMFSYKIHSSRAAIIASAVPRLPGLRVLSAVFGAIFKTNLG